MANERDNRERQRKALEKEEEELLAQVTKSDNRLLLCSFEIPRPSHSEIWKVMGPAPVRCSLCSLGSFTL